MFINMSSDRPLDLEGLRRAFSYPRSNNGAITDLGQIILEKIAENGPIPFQDYMAECLYHPEHGYYARPEKTIISKKGDFITSVSVGHVFGKTLAQRLHQLWQENGGPHQCHLYEIGAHDGSLAQDILAEVAKIGGSFQKAIRYRIIEPLEAQRKRLSSIANDQLEILSVPPETPSEFGFLLANEVLDALPVPILLHSNNSWHEVLVSEDNNILTWDTRPTQNGPEGTFSEGYVTEAAPDFHSFLSPLTTCFQNGLFIFIDYGLDEPSLYHPTRNIGTFRCYRDHSTKCHPLDSPGQQDLTADVNFTAFEDTATILGLTLSQILDQSRYLTHSAKNWLLTGNATPTEIQQFQTLIHPSQFGTRFYALELAKGELKNGIF